MSLQVIVQRGTSRTLAQQAIAGCVMLTSLFAWPLHARERPVIAVGEPAGFANVTAERSMIVDIYYGNTRRGESRVDVTPGAIRFADPDEVLGMLPPLERRDRILAAISGQDVPSNAGLRCSPGADPLSCGRMTPPIIGVIFDPEKFRVDVFLNPEFVQAQSDVEERFLPPASGGATLINSIGGILSGQLGEPRQYASVFDQLVVAQGAKRIRADLGYSSALGWAADRVQLEVDRPGVRYSAGALWAPGTEIEGRRKILGVGLQSQIDTRLDKDSIAGTPLVLYLEQRGRVDVVRDGRLLASAIYEAGNQQIDTSSFPDGSYPITLHVEEPGRPPRDERRFFTKSRQIPSPGRTDFFLFGGLFLDDDASWNRDRADGAFVHGGLAIRPSQSWALAGNLELSGTKLASELSATYLTPVGQVRAAAVADTAGAVGGVLQVASSGTARLNFNFDLRRVWQDPNQRAGGALVGPAEARGSYAQFGGLVSYNLANVRFLGSGYYREDTGVAAQYSVGPALEWDVLRRGRLTLTVRGDMTVTERGNAGFAGISLRMLGARAQYSALVGGRLSSLAGDELGQGEVAALAGAWTSDLAGGELALGGGLEHQPKRDSAVLSGDFRHPMGSLSLDFAHTDTRVSDSDQYSLGFQTTVTAGAGEVAVAGKITSDSLLVARVEGAGADDRFEVLVNEQPAGSIIGAQALRLALPGYRSYRVRIRPTGARLLAYDNGPRSIILYPGAVAKAEWTVAPVTVKVGRLATYDGVPVRGAVLTARGVWAETDSDGLFQIEVPDNAELMVSLPDGTAFASILPAGKFSAGVFRVGTVVCCNRAPRLGLAVSLTSNTGD